MYHNSPLLSQESQTNVPTHLVLQPQVPAQQTQRQRVQRDEQTADFRKFKQNFILSTPKGQRANVRKIDSVFENLLTILLHTIRQDQNQTMQHPNQSGPLELRSTNDEHINQTKPFPKPYANQMKQYPPIETLSNAASIQSMNVDVDKRTLQVNPQQVN